MPGHRNGSSHSARGGGRDMYTKDVDGVQLMIHWKGWYYHNYTHLGSISNVHCVKKKKKPLSAFGFCLSLWGQSVFRHSRKMTDWTFWQTPSTSCISVSYHHTLGGGDMQPETIRRLQLAKTGGILYFVFNQALPGFQVFEVQPLTSESAWCWQGLHRFLWPTSVWCTPPLTSFPSNVHHVVSPNTPDTEPEPKHGRPLR